MVNCKDGSVGGTCVNSGLYCSVDVYRSSGISVDLYSTLVKDKVQEVRER